MGGSKCVVLCNLDYNWLPVESLSGGGQSVLCYVTWIITGCQWSHSVGGQSVLCYVTWIITGCQWSHSVCVVLCKLDYNWLPVETLVCVV